MERLISDIKNDFKTNIDTPFKGKLSRARGKVDKLATEINTQKQWGEKTPNKMFKDLEKATKTLKKLEAERDSIETNKIYEEAFEWRFEFPEVLNDDGDFVGFDVVIGNPPYLSYYSRESVGIESNFEDYLHSHFAFLDGYSRRVRKNSLMIFLELGMKLLNQKSVLIYICDLNLLEKPSIPIRQFIHNHFNIVEVISNLNVFKDVASGQVIIELENDKQNENTYRHKSNSFIEYKNVNQSLINEPDYSFIPALENSILAKIDNSPLRLQDCFDIKVGINIGGVKERFLHADNINNQYYKFINGGDNVQRWKITFPTEKQIRKGQTYVDFNKTIEKEIWDNKIGTPSIGKTNDRFLNHKVVIRQSDTKLSSVLDFDQYHCDYNLFTATSIDNNDDELYNLIALLNSDVYSYYVIEKGILNIKPGKTPQIRVTDVKTIPFFKMESNTLLEVKNIVNQIQEGNIDLTERLNEIVNDLVGLSNEEIETIKRKDD